MRNFDYSILAKRSWDSEIIGLVAQIHEYKGRQELYLKQKPAEFDRLIEIAKVQSTEASNEIEGIRITNTRLLQLCKHQLSKISMQSFPIKLYLKGNSTMIDALYNYRQGEIHSAEFSDEFNKLCIPFEDSLNEERIDIFHQILDCVSETAAAEMRAAYRVGFKDGATMMQEIQD